MTSQHLPQTPATTHLPPPFVNAPGLLNFRDAGGHLVTVGDRAGRATVRRGVLFRSAEIGIEGGEALRRLRVTRVFDLRSAVESGTPGYRVAHGETAAPVLPESWEGIDRVWLPVFLDQDYSPEAIAMRFQKYSNGTEGFVAAYRSILEAAGSPDNQCEPFRTILETLASSPTPILVHCSAGKDRTGVLIALILSLLGVDDATIAADFHLTELGLADVKPAIVSKLTNGPHLGGDRAKAERMVTASTESMLGTLAMIRDTYGSVEGYLVDHCRVSRETLEKLRRSLVEEVHGVAGEEE